MKRIDVCNKALEYLETKFHHQGRLKNIGIDCAGLIVEIAKECGLHNGAVEDLFGYSKFPDGVSLMKALVNGTAKEKTINDLKIGDIILFHFQRNPQHLGIYMPNNQMIHAYSVAGKVLLHDFDDKWKRRVVSVYEYYNIED